MCPFRTDVTKNQGFGNEFRRSRAFGPVPGVGSGTTRDSGAHRPSPCIKTAMLRRANMGGMSWVRMGLLGSMLTGCTVPVAGALEEGEANSVAVALERAGVDAAKEADPQSEGKYRITVARDDAPEAIAILRDEELPRAHPKGVLDAVGQGALVPSQSSEHAQYVAGVAGDLERTLLGVEGVLRARVHLNLPTPDPLRPQGTPLKATASVLVEHRGSTPPLTVEAVQKLVAGGVNGLAPADVAVVHVSRPQRSEKASDRLAHVGPFAVAKGSKGGLQGLFAILVLTVGLLALVALVFYTKAARLQRETERKG